MWGKELHSVDFINRMLEHVKDAQSLYRTQPRILGMLSVCKEEIESPFYYTANGLSGTVHSTSIKLLQVMYVSWAISWNVRFMFSSQLTQVSYIRDQVCTPPSRIQGFRITCCRGIHQNGCPTSSYLGYHEIMGQVEPCQEHCRRIDGSEDFGSGASDNC